MKMKEGMRVGEEKGRVGEREEKMENRGSQPDIHSTQPRGHHECQILGRECDEAAESAAAWAGCRKNPGHRQFISVSDYIDNQLPCSVDDQYCEWVKVTADVTVRLRVSYTSQDRPDDDPFSKVRGSINLRLGTGLISDVYSDINEPCPCNLCNGHEVRKYWTFDVRTAKHVVYNTEEAKKAQVDLFYNDERSHQDGKVVSVPALKVVWSRDDRCCIECVTHDERIGEMVESLYHHWYSLTKSIESSPVYSKEPSLSDSPREILAREPQDYALIISHPHGQAKKITVGKLRDAMDINHRYQEYHTATCPGSSGATMFWLYVEDGDAGLRQWRLRNSGFPYSARSFIHSGTLASSVSADQINFGNFNWFV